MFNQHRLSRLDDLEKEFLAAISEWEAVGRHGAPEEQQRLLQHIKMLNEQMLTLIALRQPVE